MDEGEPRIAFSGADAEIRGVHEISVSSSGRPRHRAQGGPVPADRVDRGDVEQVAPAQYAHKHHPDWTTTAGAAEILAVTPNRGRQLVDRGSGRRCSTTVADTSVAVRS